MKADIAESCHSGYFFIIIWINDPYINPSGVIYLDKNGKADYHLYFPSKYFHSKREAIACLKRFYKCKNLSGKLSFEIERR